MKTILSLDDDKWILETLHAALTMRGYEVLTANSEEAARQILQTRNIDLVLLDLQMPGKNGFTLLREFNALRPIPVLFVSGCSRSFSPDTKGFTDIWQKEFAEGQTDILYKPFHISLLYEKVESLIGQS